MFFESKIEEFRKKISETNMICITVDIDWASEYAIEKTIEFFNDINIPITLFVTHKSKVIESHKRNKLIDLGIHPNFIVDSSQGNTIDEIVDYCMNIVPDAKAVRCHRWYSSNDIYDKLIKEGIRYESNNCALLDDVKPFIHRSGLLSLPVYFEDGAYIQHGGNFDFQSISEKYFDKPGLKIIDIHPMHLMLNTPNFKYTRNIKDTLSRHEWNDLGKDQIEKLRYNGPGIYNFIMEMMDFMINKNINISTLEDIYKQIDIKY